MTILICNDDGVQSEGLHSLREGLIGAGYRTVAVAPHEPRSGTSRSATFRRPVTYWQVGGTDENPVYACDGTPVDCVRVALMSDLVPDARLVISGINEGANLGDDATYSSTVGAAIEGALFGLPAISTSQQSTDGLFRLVDLSGYDWRPSVESTVWLAGRVLERGMPPRTVLNLNAPGVPADSMRMKVTRLGHRTWRRRSLQVETNDHGTGYFLFDVNSPGHHPYEEAEGTDFAALAAGHVSVSPLSVHWADGLAGTGWIEDLGLDDFAPVGD